MIPSSMTLNDLWPGFQGHDIFWSRMSEKRVLGLRLCLKDKVTVAQEETIANIWNGATFGDLDWPLNASRGVCQHQLSFLLTEITVYLGNGTRYANDYYRYGTVIGSRRWRINACLFRWPWMTLTRVTRLQVEYLKKVRLRDTVTIEGNHSKSIEWYHFQWPQVTSDPDFKVTTFLEVNIRKNGAS